MLLRDRAPAKINLTLHITGRRADGYHLLDSLVVFSGRGDRLGLEPDAPLGLLMDGPTAIKAGPDADNLVLRAARHLAERVVGLRLGAFHLTKRLPVAAGIGGGSSDAAAALRLLARLNGLSLEDPRLMEAARATGADVPVCVAGRARTMAGIGEVLGPVLEIPALYGVLVNPGVALETRPVFAAIGLAPGKDADFGPAFRVPESADAESWIAALRRGRNDMEAAACRLAPVIGDVLAVLAAAPGCRLARMSGSGATCFGLFTERRRASRAAAVLRRDHPGWWVQATRLR